MSSPSARFSVPPPRRDSNDGGSTSRSSIEQHQRRDPALAGQYRDHTDASSSSSRRPSNGSLRQSPTSISGHSHSNSIASLRDEGNHYPSSNYGSGSGSASASAVRQGSGGSNVGSGRLPRIRTSHADPDESDRERAPRSAPINGPLRPPEAVFAQNGPTRSSSSPEPWLSNRSSPSHSPTDYRPNFASGNTAGPSALGPGVSHGQGRQAQQPSGVLIPPRSSSQTENSRPITPESGSRHTHESDDAGLTPRNASDRPAPTRKASTNGSQGTTTPRSKRHDPAYCGQCGNVVHGQFVRAMGKVYHLDCFRCKDCGKVVAQKFFPVEEPEGMYPLCERDYFARLDLICAKCDQALRSSYITACGNKYHVEHFTCSECDVLFGPNDSYYEHGSKVYCHYHYSTRFAVKCVGCETAILKQFVEMNRNGKDECWHPECYMISKFWNVRLASKNFNTPANSAVSSAVSLLDMTPSTGMTALSTTSSSASSATSPGVDTELTPEQLKEKQEAMEMKVQQIWHVLSGYEESSAALIGDMLRAVNNRQLLDIILLAERFILYVEVLFAVIDDLEAQFALAGAKGMSHAREAKHLCRRLVNLLSAMSQISPNTQDLFTLITQLAHYLKILIRVALTGAIKLERDMGNTTAMGNCLSRLNLLAMDNGDPTVKHRGDHPHTDPNSKTGQNTVPVVPGDDEQLKRNVDALTRSPQGFIASTQMVAYGYRSLAPEVTGESTLRGTLDEDFVPPEGCVYCRQPVEEDCIRLGMFNRWHPACLICVICGDKAGLPPPAREEISDEGHKDETVTGPNGTVSALRSRRQAPRVDEFFYDAVQAVQAPENIYCLIHRNQSCKNGFKTVSRLEQYAFLLHIALRRLYVHFRVHHELPSVRGQSLEDPGLSRNDPDVKRVKSVTLDRKLSSTARLPQRSTVVESPAGRMADANGQVVSARHSVIAASPSTPSGASAAGDEQEEGSSATVDVIRPPFARNNTSVMIISEGSTGPEEQHITDSLTAASIAQDDDAITLGDIPLLADQTMRHRPKPADGRPLLSSLNVLQSLIVKHFALLQLQKTAIGHVIELDEVLELLESRKNQWWNKIFKGNQKKDQKKKGVFGVPIEILVERTGSDSSFGSTNDCLRVPEFIEDIVSTMRQMDMAIEGIFRKNGNIRRLQQISDQLDKDSTTVNLSEENPVQLAALLKRWLREMPDPLLTFRLHKLFCAAAALQNREERQRCLHLLVTLLPRNNRDTMEVLFVFLKWVASFSYKDEETGSRMDMPNLATVICPSILYAKGANAARDESFIAIQAVQDLLENQDEYYRIPRDLAFVVNEGIYNIFAKELDLPPKEIHRHCSKYMQARIQHGGSTATQRPAFQSQGSGMRERASDPRLSVHRSEGNLAVDTYQNGPGGANGTGPTPPGSGTTPYRPGQPRERDPNASGNPQSRPTSWVQQSHPGSQQSLHQLGSPNTTPWRGQGPFQGSANGSRNSSRGSAPNSPGPEEGRRSFAMERERSWQSERERPGADRGGGGGGGERGVEPIEWPQPSVRR